MDLRVQKNIAIMPICNTLSLIIRDCVLDVDYIMYQYSDEEEAIKTPLHYDLDGEPYFIINDERYYLKEFLKVNRNYGGIRENGSKKNRR